MVQPLLILAPCRSLCHALFGGGGCFAGNGRGQALEPPKRHGRRVLACGLEKIAVRAGAGQFKDENVLVNLVDEKPVGRDMAFAVIGPVVAERVVTICGRQKAGGFLHRLSSSSAPDSVYRGRVGSCAMRSPSSIAAMVSAFGNGSAEMVKGMRFSRTTVLMYTVITDDAERPTLLQKSTKRFLVGASSENVMFAMVFLHSFESKTRISYTKLTGLVKEAA